MPSLKASRLVLRLANGEKVILTFGLDSSSAATRDRLPSVFLDANGEQ